MRGIAVPKREIELVESMYGAKLIREDTNENKALILRLDRMLEMLKIKLGQDPEMLTLTSEPGKYFKHMPLSTTIDSLRVQIPGKPAWFVFNRGY